MAKKPNSSSALDFAFFNYLWAFYETNKGTIRKSYKELSKKFLDYNDPKNRPDAFLRRPQFEALETYIFLKEFLGNSKVEQIFEDWFESKNQFEGRKATGFTEDDSLQGSLLLGDVLEVKNYQTVLKKMKDNSRSYPNYIFALTMGTGKTLLMATCIFYEFLLANKFPKDKRFCQNALIFAPDKTVLQSLREIEYFDKSKVVPKEYVGIFEANLNITFLDEVGTSLNTLDGSKFNLVVSNTQKIILKRQHAEKSAAQQLFENTLPDYGEFADLYGDLGLPANEDDLKTNQRFEKLSRLPQLGIFVDEAHHSFGQALKKDMMGGTTKTDNSLRRTIDELAKNLNEAGTHVVACFNYTGTPYVGKDVLPEVVYAFNLKNAIQEHYLKSPAVHSYTTTRTEEFVKIAVKDFLEATKDIKPEGLLPKLAFFASTVEELTEELKPELERQLAEHGISSDKILVNVGDAKHTTSDDIRNFNNLDVPGTDGSEKQFILLVNKGREGWNCRSLFGVAMYRSPKSKVFVLQATMRCLRSIGNKQYTGSIYLSHENYEILNKELEANFKMTAEEFNQKDKEKPKRLQVHVREEVKIKLQHVKQSIKLKEKEFVKGTVLDLDPTNEEAWHELTSKYLIIQTTTTNLQANDFNTAQYTKSKDRTSEKEKVEYTSLSLVAEISRYLNLSPIRIETMLEQTKEGLQQILDCVNEFNELLYDVVIPRLFKAIYDQEIEKETIEKEVQLIIPPAVGGLSFYEIAEGKGGTARYSTTQEEFRDKSFNLDTYTFDSNPEHALFWDLLKDEGVEKIYFTGMFTDKSKTEFYFQYIDPDSYALRNYYPDFLVQLKNGQYVIVEVKGDHQYEDTTVLAKAKAAKEYASMSDIEYRMIKGTDANAHIYQHLIAGGNVLEKAANLMS
ncbi:TnsA endonuclease N-terminal domain-containing protein [Acinetobacter towneri]|uniref:TnsA endonuclease N-terminal domain-containing protein n=1 Tax=Acinetobacter towneri TaxID=202956 RepID=UPI0025776AA4|nr:TnsA endonuclease N-terminal domain-containing protein [Acinetobacter towneri]MDM1741308.1 DEAD/DEAH box helicase family protein [Acinetobacter towneri]